MKRWSKCWRRVVNRVLASVLARTDWHAYIGQLDEQARGVEFRRLFFSRDDKGQGKGLQGGCFSWLFFSRANRRISLSWTLRDDDQDTLDIRVSLPWLFAFNLSLDAVTLNPRGKSWIGEQVGVDGEGWYGLEADLEGIALGWRAAGDRRYTGFYKHFAWSQINGTPTITTTTEPTVVVVYHQPADLYHKSSSHEIRLTYRKTVRSWARFWKRDEVVVGYDVSLDEPPVIPSRGIARIANRTHDGIYGAFIRQALTPCDAVTRYTQMVQRERGTLDTEEDKDNRSRSRLECLGWTA